MSTRSRAHIRTPENRRDDDRHSAATDVTTLVPLRGPPSNRQAATTEENQKSTKAPDVQPLAAAPEPTNFDAPLSRVGNYDVTPTTAQADPNTSAAKFARCELSAAPDEPAAPTPEADRPGASEEGSTVYASATSEPPIEQEKAPPVKTALELAIDGCTALGDKSDTMVSEKWAKRAAPILAESLKFLAEYRAASEAEREAVRKLLKAKSGVSREPNVDNLPLIAVYMCVGCTDKTRTKAQRKAWGRFKTVVAVAVAVPVAPDDAAQWLEKKTLNGILADWREMQKATGKGARKPSVPKALKDYTHLAEALAEDSEFHTLATAELAKADAAVAKAMGAATHIAVSTANAAMPDEKESANA